jgi:hypothetical protein
VVEVAISKYKRRSSICLFPRIFAREFMCFTNSRVNNAVRKISYVDFNVDIINTHLLCITLVSEFRIL